MLSFLLPIASKIVSDAVNKIPENEELGEKLIEVCLVILKKAVKLTKTDMDDKLLAQFANFEHRVVRTLIGLITILLWALQGNMRDLEGFKKSCAELLKSDRDESWFSTRVEERFRIDVSAPLKGPPWRRRPS